MQVKQTVEVPGWELLDMIQKIDRVIALLLESERSLALDVALLDLRDAAKTLADSM